MNMFANILAQPYLPPSASTVAPEVDRLFNAILGIEVFFCALIFSLIVYFSIKYRHRPGRDAENTTSHSTSLELTWTIVPVIIVLILFYFGFRGFLDQTVVPPNAYEIQVGSRTWSWSFTYPNGHTDPELHIPRDRPIRLVLTSEDVIHSLYVPAFRVQKSAVPGRYNRFWFQATELGEFPIYCAQYCGTNHSEMRSKVVVHDANGFASWLEIASNPEKQAGFTPVKAGEQIVQQRGCMTCHTTTGSASTGPTFKDVFGKQELLSDGSTVAVDENYVRESILYPQKKIVKGFGPVMPSFLGTLSDKEIGWIIAYLKSISTNYHGGDLTATSAPATKPAAH